MLLDSTPAPSSADFDQVCIGALAEEDVGELCALIQPIGVLARALGLRFSETSAWLGEGPAGQRRTVAATLVEGWGTRPRVVDRRAVRLPDPLRRFVKEFDLGCFPELVDEPARVGIPEASDTHEESDRHLVSV